MAYSPNLQCNLCGSDQAHYRFMVGQRAVYECKECSFIFAVPESGVLPIDTTPTVVADTAAAQSPDVRAAAQRAAHLRVQHVLRYAAGNPRQWLVISQGASALAVAARACGFSVDERTVSTVAAAPAGAWLQEIPAAAYDVCVLDDCISLVTSPGDLLRAVHGTMADNGVLLVTTPSIGHCRNAGSIFYADTRYGYFDDQTLQNLLLKTGFINVYGYDSSFSGKTPPPPGLLNMLARRQAARGRRMVSIIVPVYNEIKTFPALAGRVLKKNLPGLDKEVIFVESNSTDGTREEVEKLRAMPGVKILYEERPRGKGHAVRAGLAQAAGDFIIIQDGDLEYDINDYDILLENVAAYRKAFVLGSRHSRGWKMRQFTTQPLIALIMNAGQIFFTALINIFCGQKMRDPFTMYKVFRNDCLFNLPLEANRFDFDWELVIKLVRKGYVPLEIPVNYASRSFHEGKKVSLVRDPLTWIAALLKYRFCPLYEQRYELPDHCARTHPSAPADGVARL